MKRFPFLDTLTPTRDEFGMPILDPNTPISEQTIAENPGEMAQVPTRQDMVDMEQQDLIAPPLASRSTPTLAAAPAPKPSLAESTITATDAPDFSGQDATIPSSINQTDSDLSEAQRQRRASMQSANMDRGIDYLLKGYATGKGGQFEVDETGYKAKIAQAELPVSEIDEQLKNTQTKQRISLDDLKNADAKSLSDPNSSVSKAYRDYARVLGANVGDTVPASQLESIRPLIEKQASLEEARMARSENRADRALDRELKMREMEAKREADKKETPLTKGQQEVDKKFAVDYNEWTSGGSEIAKNEINKLKNIANDLRNKKIETGGLTGMFPDRITSEKVLATRAGIESSVMSSLRPILGAQFTQEEGARVIKNTWNEADSTENNLKRMERLIQDLTAQAQAKAAKVKHFESSGTLGGYKSQDMSSEVKTNSNTGAYPKKLKKGTQVATVSNAEEEKEAKAEGFQ